MAPKINKVYFLISLFFFVILTSLVILLYKQNKTIVFVDKTRLFNEFRMTRELLKSGENELQKRKKVIDSIYVQLNSLEDNALKARLTEDIIKEQNELEVFQKSFSAANSENIWKRINGYVKEFSNEKGYDLIIGTQASGTVLYGEPELDITNDLLNYVNKKYEGFN